MTAVEIEDGRDGNEPLQPRGLPQRIPGVGVDSRERPIEASQRRIAQQRVNHIIILTFLAFLVGYPVILREEYRHSRRGVCMSERLASSQRFLQIRQWKARVDSQEGTLRICCFYRSGGSAGFPETVAEGCEQRLRFGTSRNTNHPIRAGHGAQLSSLLYIPLQEDQVFGRLTTLALTVVTVHSDVIGQERHYFIRRNLLADRRHPQE